MRAFGYTKTDSDAESPLELREVTLVLSKGEIDALVAFLENSKLQFETALPTPGQSHCHFRDWSLQWTGSDPDFIVVFDK